MDKILKDDRFTNIFKDPKFRRIPKNERKVKIDKRFQSMFKDKKFTVNSTVDKRGKPNVQSSRENLRKYYNLSDSEEDSDKEHSKSDKEDNDKDDTEEALVFNEKENENQLRIVKENENTKISHDIKKKLKDLSVDYARGEGLLRSDSSSDEESSDDSDSEHEINHDWGELDKDAQETDVITYRLAVCNMDWDNIRAVDIMASLNSFLPSGGLILSVTIYPSEFGMKRMQEEEINGPTELVDECINDIEDDENEEGSNYQMEKLRQYQLNRLKYYYAVVVCDSPETADKIWHECRNVEYESTGIKYDLRFVPDDMDFDQAPKEVCDKLPDFSSYQPRIFTTTALQQEKVELTWDETCYERKELTRKLNSGKIDEFNDNHLQSLLACETSEDDSEEDADDINENKDYPDSKIKENTIEKYKLLLKSIDEKKKAKEENDVELECSWGLSTNRSSKSAAKSMKSKADNLTPFEQYLDKRREKRTAKRKNKLSEKSSDNDVTSESEDDIPSDIDMNDPYFAEEVKACTPKSKHSNNKFKASRDKEEDNAELELVLMDKNEHENKNHFNMKKIEENELLTKSKKKRLKKQNKNSVETQNDDFEINVKDPRFEALFTSHHFNIDPADPHFRKTKATDSLVSEKLKRRNVMIDESTSKSQQNKDQITPELTALVKTVKRNMDKSKKSIL